MLPTGLAAGLKQSHAQFERVRGRVWIERVRVGLEYRRGMREVEEGVARARGERDALIRQAVDGGASYREVARALGLSHSRVQQIVNDGGGRAPAEVAPSAR